MQTKEEKICSFTQNGARLQLIKLTIKNKYTCNRYLCNNVGGFKLHLETGDIIPIHDEEVQQIVKRYNLKKDNENYYYYNDKNDCIKTNIIDQKFQVRLNRKIIDTSVAEYPMRKLFATYCQNIVLQQKI